MARRQILHSDNLHCEHGEFAQRQFQPVHVIEKVCPVKYSDNLKNEGEFYFERNSDFKKFDVERQKPCHREDNIHVSTDAFDGITTQQSFFSSIKPEMRTPIIHSDNLILENGEFTKRETQVMPTMKKAVPVKHTETLKMDGEFYGERNSDYKQVYVEKQKPFIQEDNLHVSTEPFETVTMKQSQFLNFTPEKLQPIIHKDNL